MESSRTQPEGRNTWGTPWGMGRSGRLGRYISPRQRRAGRENPGNRAKGTVVEIVPVGDLLFTNLSLNVQAGGVPVKILIHETDKPGVFMAQLEGKEVIVAYKQRGRSKADFRFAAVTFNPAQITAAKRLATERKLSGYVGCQILV